ncbi:MAG TPA: response regulator [Aggregatilineales bacterium]|nr:response regulator [Anaerolineales bacterium]HRE46584.1 response regulator [Aggregatilineales bacterium]
MAEKILIVDDDVDSLKLIGLMLNRQGYEIIAANSGGQAFTKAVAERPNLIILDVMMPDMDGLEICRRLRGNAATQGIPIIMFTAKTLIDDKVAGFEAGADDYLTKPTHPAELASRVKAILARNVAQRKTPGAGGSSGGAVVTFLGVKGGVGTTTLAVNTAAAFQQKEGTILADIRPGQGSMGLYLNLSRAAGMANLLPRSAAEITPRMVEQDLAQHPSGLRVLNSTTRPREMGLLPNPDTASAIVKVLRGLAAHVVIDSGVGLTPLNARLIKESNQSVIVVEPTRPALHMAREILKELETMGVGRPRLNVAIVSRTQTQVQVPWQEAEQILGQEMVALIGAAPELAFQATEAGFPVVLFQPASVASTQLNKLAEELLVLVRSTAG